MIDLWYNMTPVSAVVLSKYVGSNLHRFLFVLCKFHGGPTKHKKCVFCKFKQKHMDAVICVGCCSGEISMAGDGCVSGCWLHADKQITHQFKLGWENLLRDVDMENETECDGSLDTNVTIYIGDVARLGAIQQAWSLDPINCKHETFCTPALLGGSCLLVWLPLGKNALLNIENVEFNDGKQAANNEKMKRIQLSFERRFEERMENKTYDVRVFVNIPQHTLLSSTMEVAFISLAEHID